MFAMVFFQGARGNIVVFRAPFLFDHKTRRLAIPQDRRIRFGYTLSVDSGVAREEKSKEKECVCYAVSP